MFRRITNFRAVSQYCIRFSTALQGSLVRPAVNSPRHPANNSDSSPRQAGRKISCHRPAIQRTIPGPHNGNPMFLERQASFIKQTFWRLVELSALLWIVFGQITGTSHLAGLQFPVPVSRIIFFSAFHYNMYILFCYSSNIFQTILRRPKNRLR